MKLLQDETFDTVYYEFNNNDDVRQRKCLK